jgi:hypothetical protein
MTKMPSKNEVAQYKLLSDKALQEFKVFCAAGRLPRPDKLTQGAFDSLSPELKRRLAQLTPKQKREVAIALDAGEDPNGDLDVKKFATKLLEGMGDGQDDSGFGEKLIRLLDQCFPGCCGELTGEDEEAGETGYSPEEDMADDDEDDDWSPEGQFRKAANDTFNSAEQPGPAAKSGPRPFPGMPRTGGKLVGMDEASDDYARRFPETKRIGIDDNFGKKELSVPRSPLNKLAFDARVAKRVNQELDDVDDYDARFPETARIGLR